MKKIILILGRGIEGCGVTKFTLEFIEWLETNDYDYKAFAVDEKAWTRKYAHDFAKIENVNFTEPEVLNRVINNCNLSDFVIINSLPSKSHSPELIETFNLFLESIRAPQVLIQHDHFLSSIKRNQCVEKAVEMASVIFTHALDNDFNRVLSKINAKNKISPLFGDTESSSNFFTVNTFQPGLNFDRLRKFYWKPIEKQNDIHCKWIGRTASWKGIKTFFNFNRSHLGPNKFLTTMEGVDKSPYIIPCRRGEWGEWEGILTRKDGIEGWDVKPDEKIYMFGTYTNEKLLERLSTTAFGFQLSKLDPRFLHKSIEYTHAEIVAVGSVPVFHEKIGQACIHRQTGDPLIQSSDSGTIWLSESESKNQKAFDKIKRLAENPIERDNEREKAFEFYKSHQDAKPVFSELIQKITNNI